MFRRLAEPKDILPPDPPDETKPLTLTLYANGHLIPCDASDVQWDEDGIGATVLFRTSKNALASGTGDPRIERVWGDKQAGQLWFVRPPHPAPPSRYPRSGCVVIQDVIIPAHEVDGVKFRVRANTPVIDWNTDDPLADVGEEIDLPASWLDERA